MTEEPIKVVLFAADCGGYDIERSMEELAALAQANGMEAVAEVVQKRETPEAATFLGEGRLAEGRMLCINLGAECAVFDAELSGSQIRNLEELLEVQVIDRTMLILEIFASRAVTNEGKLQTELATLQYRLPRLAGLGASLSRQGGGGGGGAGARRGAGESKLEYDRRHVRRRIDALRERLEELERRRAETRKSREKSGVPVVALVGYTNVGKSSLLNRLCGAQVLEADSPPSDAALGAGLCGCRHRGLCKPAAAQSGAGVQKHAGGGRLCGRDSESMRRFGPGGCRAAGRDGRRAGRAGLWRYPADRCVQ